VATLASVYGLRMFGLFLILPVLAIYAQDLDGATPMLMGIALGVYGISQAVFQLPFGYLSDHFGRKPMILFGLGLFIVGSLVAAWADTITGVIIGRALQGSGAIAAVVLALTSDLTRENQRTKAMAIIGMSIGLAFMLALIAAPLLSSIIGVQGLFVMTALLAIVSMVVVVKLLPAPQQVRNLDVRAVPATMWTVLKSRDLQRLNLGIFILHFVLTAMFVAIPIVMVENIQLSTDGHWRVYVPALLISVVLMVPLIILSARRNWTMRVFLTAVCILISRIAPAATKGSAMGVYNTFQFLGVFCGGLTGGTLYGRFDSVDAVYIAAAFALIVWIVILYRSKPPRLLDGLAVCIADNVESQRFLEIEGVEEAVVVSRDGMAYLKVDPQLFDSTSLADLIYEPN